MRIIGQFYDENGMAFTAKQPHTGGVFIELDNGQSTVECKLTTEQVVDLAYQTLRHVIGGCTTETVEALGEFLRELRDDEIQSDAVNYDDEVA